MENIWSNWFAKIRELFFKKNVYDPIVMNNLIEVNNRTMLMAAINHMAEKRFSLKVIQAAITYFVK